jgi:hypothetical protein
VEGCHDRFSSVPAIQRRCILLRLASPHLPPLLLSLFGAGSLRLSCRRLKVPLTVGLRCISRFVRALVEGVIWSVIFGWTITVVMVSTYNRISWRSSTTAPPFVWRAFETA